MKLSKNFQKKANYWKWDLLNEKGRYLGSLNIKDDQLRRMIEFEYCDEYELKFVKKR